MALQDAMSQQHGRGVSSLMVSFPDFRSDDQVDDARFVFECHECDPLGSTRPLTHQDQSGHT